MSKLTFRYTRPPPTQVASTAGIALAAIGLAQAPAFVAAWAAFVEGTSSFTQLVAVPFVAHLALYWSVSLAFHAVDTHDRPALIARYRIQTGPPKRPPLDRVLKNLAVNQLFWTPVMLTLVWGVLIARGWQASPELPGLLRLTAEVAGMGAVAVVWFYATHRFLHRKVWMARVHRVHHEFRTTAAMASEYAHGLEFTLGNFGTLAIGVVLLAPSLASIYLFSVIAIVTFLAHHCGYALPWVSWPVHHDWHHYRAKECFGTLGLLDRLLGTDEEFRTLKDGDER